MSGETTKVILDSNGRLPQSEEYAVKELSDLALKSKQADATEKMYLGEIRVRDVDNLSLLLKASKEYTFSSLQHAMHFMGQSLNRGLCKLGCKALDYHAQRKDPQNTDTLFVERVLQKQMLKKQVKCEHRSPDIYPPEERWRSGLYMYKANEIAYFISNPMKMHLRRRGSIILVEPEVVYMVKTNVPKE